jgi:hypothetical protein
MVDERFSATCLSTKKGPSSKIGPFNFKGIIEQKRILSQWKTPEFSTCFNVDFWGFVHYGDPMDVVTLIGKENLRWLATEFGRETRLKDLPEEILERECRHRDCPSHLRLPAWRETPRTALRFQRPPASQGSGRQRETATHRERTVRSSGLGFASLRTVHRRSGRSDTGHQIHHQSCLIPSAVSGQIIDHFPSFIASKVLRQLL